MPVLIADKRIPGRPTRPETRPGRSGLLESCANSGCASGWLHLWRSRSAPVFEEGWTCSPACTEERLRAAVRRELDGRSAPSTAYRHRLPLGLLMMEKGWITSAQLRRALEAQKAAGGGRLGQYLVRQQAASEELVTRALSLQWSCPVLSAAFQDPESLAPLMPRLFIDAFGAVPLRMAAGKILYVGFEERLDAVLALALERMSGLRVESGLVHSSEFGPAQARMLAAAFPPVQLLEAVSEAALAKALARAVERGRPLASRLVRVHDCVWLRMWKKTGSGPVPEAHAVEDVIGSIGE
jgi:hypothetical protein